MEDSPGTADDERIIELSSIAAIFPELVLNPHSPYQASLQIPVSPAKPLPIRFLHPVESSRPYLATPPTSAEADTDDDNATVKEGQKGENDEPADIHKLEHLPPLNVHIHLPEGYPAQRPPIFELSSHPAWISEGVLRRLTEEGTRLWEELGRDHVIFTYVDHLQQAAEAGLNLAKDLGRAVTLPGELKIALLDYDLKAKREAFNSETFECGICLEPKKGAICHRLLLCSHVFCVECLQECYNRCIAEGDVDNVKCLEPGCGKDPKIRPANEQGHQGRMVAKRQKRHDPSLNPSELLQIPLAEEVVQRYVRLRRKRKLESDRETVYCPRQWCQGAARSKKHPQPIDPIHGLEEITPDSDADTQDVPVRNTQKSKTKEIPMSERLCICEDCSYAFCSVCRKGWHGELTSYSLCNPRSQEELNEEEKATAEYLAMHSSPCPTCAAPCQKTMGCNHMICFKCRTHFCYLCSSYLMESNPYQHFNDRHSQCYMRLWELEGGDDESAQVVAWDIPDHESLGSESDAGSDADSLGDEGLIRGHHHDDDDDEDIAHFSDEDEAGQGPLQRGRERPPVLADLRIEILNFARGGVANQHVVRAAIPPRQVPPPPAPAPPRRAAGGGARQPPQQRGGGRGRGGGNPVPHQNRARNDRGRGRARARGGDRAPQAAQPRAPRPQPAPHPPPGAGVQAEARVRARARVNDESDSSDVEDELPLHFPRAAPAPGQGNPGQQQPAMLRHMGIDRFLQLAQQDQEDEWDSDEVEDEVIDPVELRRRRALNQRMWG